MKLYFRKLNPTTNVTIAQNEGAFVQFLRQKLIIYWEHFLTVRLTEKILTTEYIYLDGYIDTKLISVHSTIK